MHQLAARVQVLAFQLRAASPRASSSSAHPSRGTPPSSEPRARRRCRWQAEGRRHGRVAEAGGPARQCVTQRELRQPVRRLRTAAQGHGLCRLHNLSPVGTAAQPRPDLSLRWASWLICRMRIVWADVDAEAVRSSGEVAPPAGGGGHRRVGGTGRGAATAVSVRSMQQTGPQAQAHSVCTHCCCTAADISTGSPSNPQPHPPADDARREAEAERGVTAGAPLCALPCPPCPWPAASASSMSCRMMAVGARAGAVYCLRWWLLQGKA